jgi:RNA polymerase sigma factor (TIGR02999 family)
MTDLPSGDITQLLEHSRQGDSSARKEVFERVYAELRKIAHQKLARESTLTQLEAHDLVHEVYVRLTRQSELPGENRRVFFAYAAKVMRSVIIDYVRERNSKKRGGDLVEVTMTTIPEQSEELGLETVHLEELDSALNALAQVDERCHQVVELRYFAGLSIEEIAEVMVLSPKTIKRDWQKARAFLSDLLKA